MTQTLDKIQVEFDFKLFLKAIWGDRIVGDLRAQLSGGLCLIGRLIVDPSFQRQGIGGNLMHEIENYFVEKTHSFELFTGSRSSSNIFFYQNLGYQITREESLKDKITLIYLEKSCPF